MNKEIKEPTLRAVYQACLDDPDDEVSVAALADLMLDADAVDRLAVLADLLAVNRLLKVRVKNCQKHSSIMYVNHSTRRLVNRSRISDRDAMEAREGLYLQTVRRDMRDRAAQTLASSLEDGHWYAVRMTNEVMPDHYSRSMVVTAQLEITPLDGGIFRDSAPDERMDIPLGGEIA